MYEALSSLSFDMQMKLIAPLVLVTWLLSDYSLCHQRADITWDLLIAAINKPVALVTTVRKVRSLLALLVQKKVLGSQFIAAINNKSPALLGASHTSS